MKAVCIAVVLLFACSLVAQQLPDAPSTQMARTDSAQPSGHNDGAPSAAASVGENGTADNKFWAWTSVMTLTTVANIEVTGTCLRQNNCYNNVSPVDTMHGLAAIALPVDFGVAAVSYKLKKSGKKLWWLPQAVVIAGNTAMLIRSAGRIK